MEFKVYRGLHCRRWFCWLRNDPKWSRTKAGCRLWWKPLATPDIMDGGVKLDRLTCTGSWRGLMPNQRCRKRSWAWWTRERRAATQHQSFKAEWRPDKQTHPRASWKSFSSKKITYTVSPDADDTHREAQNRRLLVSAIKRALLWLLPVNLCKLT